MGRSGSSSKKKYSKKKSLKVSSEARRKKRSKRNKSKKIHQHDDSYSSCSDDDLTSSSLGSSSSSEGEYKSRKSRSRTRKEVKGSKKRTRRRSCSADSTNDSPPVKKRKRSKKKGDYEKKKNKKKIKKKSRRDDYTSSSSSDSSSYGDGDGSDKDTIKVKTGNRKNRSRPRRSSSPNNSYDDDNIENVMVENNPRRLKSVITIATQAENEEGGDMKRDELKEEMVYDYDYDYPSCKSNDSNDGETKKELVDEIPVISKEKDNASDNLDSGVDDLESILRQKALENLSRFRGGIQTKTVVPVDNNKQKNDESVNTVNHVQTPVSQPVIQKSRFTWRRDASVSNGKDEKTATYSGPDSSRSPAPAPAPAPKVQSAGLSSTDRVENKITNEASKNMTNTHESTGGLETNEVKKSTAVHETPSSGSTKDGSSKEQQPETNENSQFEKKTMSVMRGGEMVQVSYKVYIPNRAPALARRQLKR